MRETDSDWYTRHFNEDYRTLYAARNDAEAGVQTAFAIEQLEIQPDDRVLDLCCGHGRHLEALARRNIRATGVDLSLPLLKEALLRGSGALLRGPDTQPRSDRARKRCPLPRARGTWPGGSGLSLASMSARQSCRSQPQQRRVAAARSRAE